MIVALLAAFGIFVILLRSHRPEEGWLPWTREAFAARGTDACIPSSRSRKIPIPHDPAVYRRRHRIENLFARLKDWRRIATRYDRCAHTFMAAITIAAIMIFWINES